MRELWHSRNDELHRNGRKWINSERHQELDQQIDSLYTTRKTAIHTPVTCQWQMRDTLGEINELLKNGDWYQKNDGSEMLKIYVPNMPRITIQSKYGIF